jgi:cell division septum initiation protein DivIVA
MQEPREKQESQQATRRPGAGRSEDATANGGASATDTEISHLTTEILQAAELPRPDTDRSRPASGGDAPKAATPPDAKAADETAAAATTANSSGAEVDAFRIGHEVDAVLKAAGASAERIRTNAERDAEAIRGDAREAAERLLADAQREGLALRAELQQLRREVDAYGKRVRADAEAYATETRKSAEEDARSKSSEAEHVLRSARKEAAKIIREATGDGQRRKTALEVEAARFEERFANILTIFNDMSSQLEGVLRAKEQRAATSVSEDESLADDLKDAASAKQDEDESSSAATHSSSERKSEAKGKSGRSGRPR